MSSSFIRRTQAKLDAMKACGCVYAEIRNGEFWALIHPRLYSIGKQYRITAWTPHAKRIGLGVTTYGMSSEFGLPKIMSSAKRDIGALSSHGVEFLIGGKRYSLEQMLEANDVDEDCCDWLRSAKPGDVYEAMHAESVQCAAA